MQPLTLFMLLALLACSARAEEVNFYGVLVPPPQCTISGGNTLEIDFGDKLGVNKIDGVNYRKQVEYQLECPPLDPEAPPMQLQLAVNGVATAFDNAALQTNVADLGLRLTADDKPLPLNAPVTIDPLRPPELWAVPVKDPNGTLQEGAFEASATLLAEYQ